LAPLALPLLAADQRDTGPAAAGAGLGTTTDALLAAVFRLRKPRLLDWVSLVEKIGQIPPLNIPENGATNVQNDVVLNSAKAAALARNFHIGSPGKGEVVLASHWQHRRGCIQVGFALRCG